MISRDRYHHASDSRRPAEEDEPARHEPARHERAHQPRVWASPPAGTTPTPSRWAIPVLRPATPPARTPSPQADSAEQGKGLEVYGDSAYGTREARAAYREGGHDTVIKPKS